MIEISLNNVIKNYGFKNVLDDFCLELKAGERVALIGPNGCGKTTVFKVIIGEENYSSGNVSIRKGATISMLSQMPMTFEKDISVIDVIKKGKKELFDLEKKMHLLEEKLGSINQDDLDNTLKSYGKLQEYFESLGGYQTETNLNKICTGFKIDNSMLNRKYSTLSGGEKTIVNFAALIFSEPSILLLDEPTNHLDIETLEWLEEYLLNYKGSMLISSHDRYFLDRVTNKTILMDKGKSEVFFGNYSYFVEENENRIMLEFMEFKDQQKQISAMKASIKKLQEFGKLAFPGGESFFKRAASIQKRLDKLELLDKPEEKRELPLDFQTQKRSGKDVLKIEDLSFIIGDKILFDDANLYLSYGKKACLMGKNGSGKSTLIKLILGKSPVEELDGKITLGSSLITGYLPQDIKFDNEQATILEFARNFYSSSETHLRSSLAKFLFYGENVFKRVGNLSGGEKVRLKLFELIQKQANFLILDEPTNHIDIDTREMLEEALIEYKGTILFVSHDRYFIDKLSDETFEIENKKIYKYHGNYSNLKNEKQRTREVAKPNVVKKID